MSSDEEVPDLKPLNASDVADECTVPPPSSDQIDLCIRNDINTNRYSEPVPVLLLTGYLGSGKTTLVNHILTAKHGYRCAVLLNEIGDTADIEKALVKEPEVWILLPKMAQKAHLIICLLCRTRKQLH